MVCVYTYVRAVNRLCARKRRPSRAVSAGSAPRTPRLCQRREQLQLALRRTPTKQRCGIDLTVDLDLVESGRSDMIVYYIAAVRHERSLLAPA